MVDGLAANVIVKAVPELGNMRAVVSSPSSRDGPAFVVHAGSSVRVDVVPGRLLCVAVSARRGLLCDSGRHVCRLLDGWQLCCQYLLQGGVGG
jgi:hypothetical protein